MKKVKCPYCSHKSPITEERCEECGGPLPEQESPPQKEKAPKAPGSKNRMNIIALVIAGVFSMVFIVCVVLSAVPYVLSLVSGSSESVSSSTSLQQSQSTSLSSSKAETEATSMAGTEGRDPFMPPYPSYDAADYTLPQEQVFDMEGSGENSSFRMSVFSVSRAPFLKYSTFDMGAYPEEEREGAWYQALHCDTVICEMTLENLQDTDLTLYTSDIKVTVDEGAYTISRPPMEVIHDSALPIETNITLAAGEKRGFVAAFVILSSETVKEFTYTDLLEREPPLDAISIFFPMEPLSKD